MVAAPHISRWGLRMAVARRMAAAARMAAGEADTTAKYRLKPRALLLIGFSSEDDRFDYELEDDPRFLRRIEQSRRYLRQGRGVGIEDFG